MGHRRYTQTCEDGEWGSCEGMVTQEEEACDGRDNDCDGETDEDLSLGSCVPEGMTEAALEERCLEAEFVCENGELMCKVDSTQIAEQCNGKDDDCDGEIDEDLSLGICVPEGMTEVALEERCLEAELICENGELMCKVDNTQEAEQCNGKDDDCDGETDEDLDITCYTGSSGCEIKDDGEWECQGICRTGAQRCIHGELSEQCDSEVTPSPSEECYVFPALDDDCDGDIDEYCDPFDVHLVEGDPNLCSFSATPVGPELTLLFDAAFVETRSESSDTDEEAFVGCKIEVGFTMLRSSDDRNYYAGLSSFIQSGFIVSHGGTATIDAHVDINGHPAHQVMQTWNPPAMEATWLSDNEASLAPVFPKSDQCADDLQLLSGTITIRFDLSSHRGDNILGIDVIGLRFVEDWCDDDS